MSLVFLKTDWFNVCVFLFRIMQQQTFIKYTYKLNFLKLYFYDLSIYNMFLHELL